MRASGVPERMLVEHASIDQSLDRPPLGPIIVEDVLGVLAAADVTAAIEADRQAQAARGDRRRRGGGGARVAPERDYSWYRKSLTSATRAIRSRWT